VHGAAPAREARCCIGASLRNGRSYPSTRIQAQAAHIPALAPAAANKQHEQLRKEPTAALGARNRRRRRPFLDLLIPVRQLLLGDERLLIFFSS
jgi:hypothetical protein